MHALVFDPNRSVLPTRFNLAWEGQTLVVPAVLEEVLQLFNRGRSAEQLGSAIAAFPSAFLGLGISPEDMTGAILDAQNVLAERLGPKWLKAATAPARIAFGAIPSNAQSQ